MVVGRRSALEVVDIAEDEWPEQGADPHLRAIAEAMKAEGVDLSHVGVKKIIEAAEARGGMAA